MQYQYTVLEALQEVSDALISRQKSAEARVHMGPGGGGLPGGGGRRDDRYRMGQASYYEVLQEQQLLFPAENAFVQSELNEVFGRRPVVPGAGRGLERKKIRDGRVADGARRFAENAPD